MKKILIILTIVVIALWILGNLFTYPLQQYFIFRPEVLDEDHRFGFDHPFEEVFLESADMGLIHALHFKEPNSKGVVLYFHGNAGSLLRWGELNDEFRDRGYDLFIMDFRGFGKSKGKMNEEAFYSDAERCFEYLAQQYSPEEIIIYGRSMGSGMASYLASKVQVKHLILETPFASVKDLFYTYYTFLPRVFAFKFHFDNHSHLKEVKFPVTIFHGTNDLIVPYSSAVKLKEVLKEEDEFVQIEGGTHNDLLIFDRYQQKMAAILD